MTILPSVRMAAVANVQADTPRALVRKAVFLHQDGIMLSTTAAGMDAVGVLRPALSGEASVAELCPAIPPSGFGYLRVGLHCLASQGWLDLTLTDDPKTTTASVTDAGRAQVPYLDRYLEAGAFLNLFPDPAAGAWARPWSASCSAAFEALAERAVDGWELGPDLGGQQEIVAAHLDGALAVPAMTWLHAGDALGEKGPELPSDETGEAVRNLLVHLGWLEGDGERWTSAGARARLSSRHYGLVGSYLPLLARLPELYRGELTVTSSIDGDGTEWHVHRELNVDASGAAHGRYFADADELIAEVFNREPLEAQPRFVADMGCGDGSWLVRIYELIRARTLRGRHLDEAPLLMVGLDCNEAALGRARDALGRAQAPALVLDGDVSYPDRVGKSLAEHGMAMEDGLHVRSFIDHDRNYLGADSSIAATGWATGAYVGHDGHPLNGADVERDLVAHLRRWTPHVGKHGLVVLEAHSVPPQVARHHVGALHSIAFEGYHGYSHQYPVEHAVFVRCCREAGLQPVSNCERHYPSTRPLVAVSLNRFLVTATNDVLPPQSGSPREDTWRPPSDPDLEDGQALHELLFVDGDLRYPRSWCSAPTGWLVAGALDVIESKLKRARPGEVIRVLDYGTGTGLAAIELLKACRERGISERLERGEVTLEVHLADLPSSWFAKGYELLSGCAWIRFHSLLDTNGNFRPLLEVTGGGRMDAIMASMVFHLIPPRALSRMAGELASALAPRGRLLWNSPDLGPPERSAVLFHDPNRELRRRWLALNDGEESAEARDRADKRVRRVPNRADEVAASLAEYLPGEIEHRAYEMLPDDFLDAILVSSNQGEYLSEIEDRASRETLIRRLLEDEVLPELEQGPAGTGLGLNVHWTLGSNAEYRGG